MKKSKKFVIGAAIIMISAGLISSLVGMEFLLPSANTGTVSGCLLNEKTAE